MENLEEQKKKTIFVVVVYLAFHDCNSFLRAVILNKIRMSSPVFTMMGVFGNDFPNHHPTTRAPNFLPVYQGGVLNLWHKLIQSSQGISSSVSVNQPGAGLIEESAIWPQLEAADHGEKDCRQKFVGKPHISCVIRIWWKFCICDLLD